jgi:PGF-CTERM protein
MNRSFLIAALVGVSTLAFAAVAIGGVTGQDTVTVDVRLVDQDGEGVGDAELTATWDGGSDTATTTNGGDAFLEVEAGADVEISVDHPVFVRNQPYEIEDAAVPDGESRLPVTVDVSRSGTTLVTVTDEASEPIPDVAVRFRQQFENRPNDVVETVRTNQNGVAETAELERGEYEVWTRAEGFLDMYRDFTLSDPEAELDITISRGSAELTVNVTDDHFDPPRPVENADVEIEDDVLSTRSDGTRTTDMAVNTIYEITVTKDGYGSVTEEVKINEADATVNVSISRTPEITVDSAQDRVVVNESTMVTVTDAYGDPVEGATVSLEGEQVGETDADGELTVQITAPGQQTVSASDGDLSDSITIEGVSPGSDETPTATPTQTATPTEEPEDDDSLGPGFGVGTALVALVAAALLARRR